MCSKVPSSSVQTTIKKEILRNTFSFFFLHFFSEKDPLAEWRYGEDDKAPKRFIILGFTTARTRREEP